MQPSIVYREDVYSLVYLPGYTDRASATARPDTVFTQPPAQYQPDNKETRLPSDARHDHVQDRFDLSALGGFQYDVTRVSSLAQEIMAREKLRQARFNTDNLSQKDLAVTGATTLDNSKVSTPEDHFHTGTVRELDRSSFERNVTESAREALNVVDLSRSGALRVTGSAVSREDAFRQTDSGQKAETARTAAADGSMEAHRIMLGTDSTPVRNEIRENNHDGVSTLPGRLNGRTEPVIGRIGGGVIDRAPVGAYPPGNREFGFKPAKMIILQAGDCNPRPHVKQADAFVDPAALVRNERSKIGPAGLAVHGRGMDDRPQGDARDLEVRFRPPLRFVREEVRAASGATSSEYSSTESFSSQSASYSGSTAQGDSMISGYREFEHETDKSFLSLQNRDTRIVQLPERPTGLLETSAGDQEIPPAPVAREERIAVNSRVPAELEVMPRTLNRGEVVVGSSQTMIRDGTDGGQRVSASVHPTVEQMRVHSDHPHDYNSHFQEVIKAERVPDKARDYQRLEHSEQITDNIKKAVHNEKTRRITENQVYGRNDPRIQEVVHTRERVDVFALYRAVQFNEHPSGSGRHDRYDTGGRATHYVTRGTVVDTVAWGWGGPENAGV